MAALYRSFYILKLLSKQAVVFDHNLTNITKFLDIQGVPRNLTVGDCLECLAMGYFLLFSLISNNLTNYGRRHLKLLTNCHVLRDNMYRRKRDLIKN